MRVTIITVGTRGDVQPYLALALGLQAAGHEVRLATQASFATFVHSYGIDFFPIQGSARDVLDARTQALLADGDNSVRYLAQLDRVAGTLVQRHMADCWQACQGTDVIMLATPAFFAGFPVAEKMRVPLILLDVVPATPTRAHPAPLVPAELYLGGGRNGGYNRLTYSVGRQIGWQLCRQAVNRARREVLDLPPFPFSGPFGHLRRQRYPVLYGYSPHVLPKPPDWGAWLHVTGYWFLQRLPGWQPPQEVVAFLEDGPPPVFVGFGSMNRNTHNREELLAVVLAALGQTGQRGLVELGGGLARPLRLSETVLQIDEAPHDWLFARTAAVVHHGGAGTTAAGLRAGIPAVIVPFYADQSFWGQRVQALGVGPAPIPRKRLTAERLAQAIQRAVGEGALRARATALGARIRGEDGVGQAVAVVQRTLQERGEVAGGRVVTLSRGAR